MKPLTILMATYNGERFLREQMDSLFSSLGFEELVEEVLVTDDGSSDKTDLIIQHYINQGARIRKVRNLDNSSGAKSNFRFGLSLTRTSYVMFCDQDDVWRNDKIIESYRAMVKAEEEMGNIPLYLFCNQKIVDSHLNSLGMDLFGSVKLSSKSLSVGSLILNNVSPGCTCIINRSLIECSSPMPESAYMHDWWLILHASVFGRVVPISKVMMFYRQHQNNTIGMIDKGWKWKLAHISFLAKEYALDLEKKRTQAAAFLERVGGRPEATLIGKFISQSIYPVLHEVSIARRCLALLALRYR